MLVAERSRAPTFRPPSIVIEPVGLSHETRREAGKDKFRAKPVERLSKAGFFKLAVSFDVGDRIPAISSAPSNTPRDDPRDAWRRDLERAQESASAIDDEEGERPKPEAFAEARAFLELLPPSVPRFSIWASGDGEVGLTWSERHGAAGFLEVVFRGTGEVLWAADLGRGPEGGSARFDRERATRLPRELDLEIEHLTTRTSPGRVDVAAPR